MCNCSAMCSARRRRSARSSGFPGRLRRCAGLLWYRGGRRQGNRDPRSRHRLGATAVADGDDGAAGPASGAVTISRWRYVCRRLAHSPGLGRPAAGDLVFCPTRIREPGGSAASSTMSSGVKATIIGCSSSAAWWISQSPGKTGLCAGRRDIAGGRLCPGPYVVHVIDCSAFAAGPTRAGVCSPGRWPTAASLWSRPAGLTRGRRYYLDPGLVAGRAAGRARLWNRLAGSGGAAAWRGRLCRA